jgi:hypothetical protein
VGPNNFFKNYVTGYNTGLEILMVKVGEIDEFNNFGIDNWTCGRRGIYALKAAFTGTTHITGSGRNNWNFSWGKDS